MPTCLLLATFYACQTCMLDSTRLESADFASDDDSHAMLAGYRLVIALSNTTASCAGPSIAPRQGPRNVASSVARSLCAPFARSEFPTSLDVQSLQLVLQRPPVFFRGTQGYYHPWPELKYDQSPRQSL